jgi:mycoredoxin
MKKILFVAVVASLALYQNWGKIERAIQGPPHFAQDEVVLYAMSTCPYCQKTRELLAEHQVPYVEMDVVKSGVARQQYDAIGGSGVPIVVVKNTIIRGYNPDAVLAALYSTSPN